VGEALPISEALNERKRVAVNEDPVGNTFVCNEGVGVKKGIDCLDIM